MDEGARKRYDEHIRALNEAISTHTLFGSASGWVLVPVFFAIGLVLIAIAGVRQWGNAVRTTGPSLIRCALEPALYVIMLLLPYASTGRLVSPLQQQRPDPQALASCVQ